MVSAVRAVAVASASELLTARGARRLAAEIGIAQRLIENERKHSTLCGERAVAIEGFVEEFLCEPIDDHVAGASVKGDYRTGRGARGNCGQVGDAADILQNPRALRMSKKHVIEERHKRRALASGQHVCRPEI